MQTAQPGREDVGASFALTPRDLEAFCRALYPELVGALRLYCGNGDAAEEIAQEALLRACASWERVATMTSAEGWVFAAAFNLARSRTRRLFRQRQAYARAEAAGAGSAETTQADAADAIAVRRAVAELPERQRRALVLRYYADLSVDATASAMGCAAGTVKALTSQAIAGLRRAGLEVSDD